MELVKPKAKKIALDMVINLMGTGIGLVVLQLIIYPIIARIIDSDSYGQMQSITSVVYLFSGTLGTSLSTTRLVREYEYNEKKIVADFNVLSCFCMIITVIGVPIMLLNYAQGLSIFDFVLVVIVGVLNFTSNYYAVGFRLKINYKAIFISKIIGSIGYIIGFLVFYFIHKWQFVFIVSFLFESLYYYKKTDLFKEPYKKSELIKDTSKTFASLGIANLLSRTLTYFDKLLLYPLLGGTAVSIYVTANVFGKLILMTIEPITNVILSYLSKKKTLSKSTIKIAIPIAGVGCVIMYFVCLLVSGPILSVFYPQWAEESLKLVPLTTFCLAISAFINIMTPFTLKAVEASKQIIFNVVGIASYIISVLFMYKPLGIKGCCVALIISYLLKLITMFILCYRRIKDDK